MIRLLHCITGLNTGGAETVLCRLLEALQPPEFEHTVVSLLPEGALSERVARLATVHHLGMRRGLATPADVFRLRRVIRAANADVVQGWMYHANVLLSVAVMGSNVPVVWGIHHSLHNYASNGLSTRLAIKAGKWCSCLPRRIVYCAASSRVDHEKIGYVRTHALTIQNGTDTTAWAPDLEARARIRDELRIAESEIAIGLVARVHPTKDHANFLRAAALLVQRHSHVIFVLVGDGTAPEQFAHSALLDELGLRPHMRLCGRRGDIVAVDNALDIASSSSYGEAFPMILGEAMACGTPCVATDVGDAREIIGDTGVVVPPRDPQALADGWTRLIELDEEGRDSLGQRARARIVERYSLKTMVTQYAEVYVSLCQTESIN